MRSSDLLSLLETDEIGALRAAIAKAMVHYRKGISRRGGAAPVELASESRTLMVTSDHVTRLAEQFLEGHLDQHEVAYVATALRLGPDFQMASASLGEAIDLLADADEGEGLSREVVTQILSSLAHS